MIHVQMGEENVDSLPVAWTRFDRSDSAAGVENDEVAILVSHLNRGGIAPVTNCGMTLGD